MTPNVTWNNNTPYSTQFSDTYYNPDNGLAEAEYVFLHQNGLPGAWRNADQYTIGELGFGTGLNFCLTWRQWNSSAKLPHARLNYLSFEQYPLSKRQISRALSTWQDLAPYRDSLLDTYRGVNMKIKGFHRIILARDVTLTLIVGDANYYLPKTQAYVDCWYLDGFAPRSNPELWNAALLTELAELSTPHASFATFTAASDVSRNLRAAGFDVEKFEGFGTKRESLRGQLATRRNTATVDTSSLPRSAVVLGAGIAGIALTEALSRRGIGVTVLDGANGICAEASGNPAAVVMPYLTRKPAPTSEFYLACFSYFLQFLSYLAREQYDTGWRETGSLQLLRRDTLRHLHSELPRLDYAPTLARAVGESEASDIAGIRVRGPAIHYPCAGWLPPNKLAETLLRLSAKYATKPNLIFATKAASLQRANQTWKVLDDNAREICNTELLFLTCGTGIKSLAPWLDRDLFHTAGQLCYPAISNSTQKLKAIIHAGHYITPACTAPTQNTHVVGASYLHDESEFQYDPDTSTDMCEELSAWLPAANINTEQLSGRMSIRVVSRDRLPILGQANNIYFSGAHASRGVLSSLLGAELIAAEVCNEPLPLPTQLVNSTTPRRFC